MIRIVGSIAVDIAIGVAPAPAQNLRVTFTRNPKMPLPDVIGTIAVNPPDPHDLVTKRTASVVLDTTDSSAPIEVDLTTGPGAFAAVVGQSYVISEVDTNAIGDSLPVSITGTVPSFATVPRAATGLTVTFAPAP